MRWSQNHFVARDRSHPLHSPTRAAEPAKAHQLTKRVVIFCQCDAVSIQFGIDEVDGKMFEGRAFEVHSAQRQVVAGLNYKINLETQVDGKCEKVSRPSG